MNNAKTEPFPKIPNPPQVELCLNPLQQLTLQLLTIIDVVSGKVFVDALPLIGGESAKEELESWKIGVQTGDDDAFRTKKALSTYTTIALTAFGLGKSAQQHIIKSQSDSIKAIFEVSSMYESYRDVLFDFKKTLKSKDLTSMEKLDALWAVTDTLYEEFKQKLIENSRNDVTNLDRIVLDLNQVFIALEKLTEGAKMIQIIEPKSNNNSNI